MDSTWPYNFDCQGVPTHLPSYYDKLIIPQIFYNGVINRNVTEVTTFLSLSSDSILQGSRNVKSFMFLQRLEMDRCEV
jgi:hypothetical protein